MTHTGSMNVSFIPNCQYITHPTWFHSIIAPSKSRLKTVKWYTCERDRHVYFPMSLVGIGMISRFRTPLVVSDNTRTSTPNGEMQIRSSTLIEMSQKKYQIQFTGMATLKNLLKEDAIFNPKQSIN
jgi:hypothetical protein